MKIVSKAFGGRVLLLPRVDLELLENIIERYHCLKCLCLAGRGRQISCTECMRMPRSWALRYQIFSEKKFLSGASGSWDSGAADSNQQLLRMHRETGIDLAATNDSITLWQRMRNHMMFFGLQTQKKLSDENRMRL